MTKKELIKNIKSIPTFILSFILVVAFFSWWGTVYNYTLIHFWSLIFLSFLLSILLFGFGFKKIFTSIFEDLGLVAVLLGLSMFLFSFLILSINYIPIGKPVIKEYKIIDSYSKKTRNNKKHYVKIRWKKKPMELRIFLTPGESIYKKKKIILETRRGLLGLHVIKNRALK